MRWHTIMLKSTLICVLLSSSAFARCDSGAEARIEIDSIEAKPIPSVVANSSSGNRFVIDSESNQIDIVMSNSSSETLRDFTSRYSPCMVIVSIKGTPVETEVVSNIFPLSGVAGFTKYLGLTIPKTERSLEYLENIVNDEKYITLKIK